MTTNFLTRVDFNHPLAEAALAAEGRLFAHFDLAYRQHIVVMDKPELRLRVLEVGEGPPLLFVPGGSGDAMMFAPLLAALKGWRVIAVNRPGGGLSDAIDHRHVDVRQLAVATIRTVADAFDLDRVPIVCNSMGGLWSFWYALAQPDRVSGMVQMGCPALALGTSAPFFMRLLGVPVLQDVIAPNMQPKTIETALDGLRFQGSRPADIARMPRVAAEATYHFFNLPTYLDTWKTLITAVATLRGARTRYALLADDLARVECPVQLIWGDNDPFGGLEVARRLVDILPDAALHEMATGHLPFLDQPEATGRIVRRFLTEKIGVSGATDGEVAMRLT